MKQMKPVVYRIRIWKWVIKICFGIGWRRVDQEGTPARIQP